MMEEIRDLKQLIHDMDERCEYNNFKVILLSYFQKRLARLELEWDVEMQLIAAYDSQEDPT